MLSLIRSVAMPSASCFVTLLIKTTMPEQSLDMSVNTEFDDIIITFTDQNGRPLEVKNKVNLTLFMNK